MNSTAQLGPKAGDQKDFSIILCYHKYTGQSWTKSWTLRITIFSFTNLYKKCHSSREVRCEFTDVVWRTVPTTWRPTTLIRERPQSYSCKWNLDSALAALANWSVLCSSKVLQEKRVATLCPEWDDPPKESRRVTQGQGETTTCIHWTGPGRCAVPLRVWDFFRRASFKGKQTKAGAVAGRGAGPECPAASLPARANRDPSRGRKYFQGEQGAQEPEEDAGRSPWIVKQVKKNPRLEKGGKLVTGGLVDNLMPNQVGLIPLGQPRPAR